MIKLCIINTPSIGKLGRLGSTAPSGMLIHGPSGCGKTKLVCALASNIAINVISVKAISLFQKYLGETERQIRALFTAARRAK